MSRSSTAAVVEGQLRHVSASQITDFKRCNRKWYFNKVLRLPTPQTESQAIGTAIHGQLENYYVKGIVPVYPSAVAALPQLPPRDEKVLSEVALTSPTLTAADVRFVGYIDLLDFRVSPVIAIVDFKTISDFKWCKKPDELSRNVQMMSYAEWAARRFPDAGAFSLTHAYLKTKNGYDAKIVSTTVTRSEVGEFFASVDSAVEEMKATARCSGAEEVTPNFNACNDYGGCPFKEQCESLSTSAQAEIKGRNTMSLKERLVQRRTASSNVVEAPVRPELPIARPAVSIVPPDAPIATRPVSNDNEDAVETLKIRLAEGRTELKSVFERMLSVIASADPELANRFDDLQFEIVRLERVIGKLEARSAANRS